MLNPEEYTKGENGYSRQQVQDALHLVEKFTITTSRKREHGDYMQWNVKQLIDTRLNDINMFLFNSDHDYYYQEYKLKIKLNDTKKELDKYLRLTLKSLHTQLATILHEMF